MIFNVALKESSHVFFIFGFQSGVGKNGRVVQGYPPISETQGEHEEDEEEEEDDAMSVSLSSGRNRPVNLRDTDKKSPQSRHSQKATRIPGQGSRASRKKVQEFTLTALDPSNLSPR